MPNEEKEVINSGADTETTANEEAEIDLDVELEDEGTGETEDKDKIIATLTAQKEHWRGKATKKAEPAKATDTKKESPKQGSTLAPTDLYALMKADVAEEDISEIQEYAQLKNISISEALKSSVVKTILAEKTEQRTTASATNVGTSKRGTGKLSDESLLDKASKGELPDSDEDLARLYRARKGIKK